MTGFFLIKGDDPLGAERIELTGQTLVGRSDECDLTVTEGHPSRRHAMLTMDTQGLWVEDLGSANGTLVNGQRIAAKTLLKRGDRVAFDLAGFVVECPEVASTPAASEATVVRHAPAAATIVRAAPPTAKPAVAAPAHPRSEAEALQKQVPRSWADPEYQGEGTRILSADEMRAMAAGGSAGANPAPAPMHVEGPHLVILAGATAGTTFTLGGTGHEWSVGAAAERDVRLDQAGVSAFHAKISQEGGRWRIIDQMSANGTWVNGQKSTISYLQDGDKLRFAQVECEFRLPAGGHLPAGSRLPQGGNVAARAAGPGAAAGNRMRSVWIAVGVALVTGLVLAAASLLL